LAEGRDEEAWMEVHRVPSLSEAEIVKALLESAGIDVRLQYDATSRVILGPGSVNPWSKVTVRVRETEKETARQLLDEALDEALLEEWDDAEDECESEEE